MTPTAPPTPVFRIDRFAVPADGLDELLARTRWVHALLEGFDGCRQSHVLVRDPEPDDEARHVLTVVEWADEAAMAAARSAVQDRYAAEGFSPAELLGRLGADADLGTYVPVGD